MKTVQWQMKENFVFPTATGMPTGAEKVMVTPRFKIERTEGSLRLIGIYHLAASIQMNLEVSIESSVESAILIDDVELNGNLGYFEYAVPFNIDLPLEANDPLNLVTRNAVCELDGQGAIAIIWDVECSYKEVIIVQENRVTEKKVEKKNETALKSEKVANVEKKNETALKSEKVANVEKKSETALKSEKAANVEKKNETALKSEKVSNVEKKSETALKQEKVKNVEQNLEEPQEQLVEAVADEAESEDSAPATATANVKLENVSFNDGDEALSFIAGLDDDISITLFHSNNVPVQSES